MSERESRDRPGSAGDVLQLIRDGRARTRAELVQLTGLARSTVTQRVDALLALLLVTEEQGDTSTGGRPPGTLSLNNERGVVLAADAGATHTRVAVADLSGAILAATAADIDIVEGPAAVLDMIADRFDELLAKAGRNADEVRAIGVGLPGPVEFLTGRAQNPPIMPGWHDYSVPDHLAARYHAPVLVDNDVNIMALGEYYREWRDRANHTLFVKVGTGIGCGIVAGGRIHRGADGAAGDIGHIQIPGHDHDICRCGNPGCLESVASGGAMARQLRELGFDTRDARDVVRLARSGEVQAVQLIRQAGRLLGEVLAGIVNFFNPDAIVFGGDIATAEDYLFAGVREVVYQRSLPLATRRLRIARSVLGDDAGIHGAAVMAIEHILAPDAVNAALASTRPANGSKRRAA